MCLEDLLDKRIYGCMTIKYYMIIYMYDYKMSAYTNIKATSWLGQHLIRFPLLVGQMIAPDH